MKKKHPAAKSMSKEIHWNNSQTQKGVHFWDNENEREEWTAWRGAARPGGGEPRRRDKTKEKKEHLIPKKSIQNQV